MITYSIPIFLVAFITVCFAIHKIIYIAHQKHLFDEPLEDRKVHLKKIPNLGGVAIFIVLLFTLSLFMPENAIANIKFLIAAAVILVTLGLTDDLVGVDPTKKFIAQLLVATLATTMGGIRFETLYGVLGITEIPYLVSAGISILFIVFMMNATNLIDGINGLAGSIGLMCCIFFSYLFWKLQAPGFLYIAIGLCGCLSGFLIYNFTPARIFMGDTGSLFLGFILSVLSIKFLNLNAVAESKIYLSTSATTMVLAMLIIPIFDTLRVFVTRLVNKKSPFAADRNHIHHLLLDLNLSHLQATGILIGVNMSVLFLAHFLSTWKVEFIFMLIVAYVMMLLFILQYLKTQNNNRGFRKIIPGHNNARFIFSDNTVSLLSVKAKKKRQPLDETQNVSVAFNSKRKFSNNI